MRLSEGTSFGQVFSYGGLVIEMGCGASGGPHGNVDFGLDTTVADAEAVAWGYYDTGAGANVEDYSAPNDFDPGDSGGLGPGADGIAGGLYGRYEINYAAPSGSVVTASIAISETTNAFGGTADCIMYGHARQSG